jgi:hypothetical protein
MRADVESDKRLDTLQRNTFDYFWSQTNPANGLLADNTHQGDVPASIAGVGMALSAYVVGADRGFVARPDAVGRTLATLRFFRESPHGPEPDATGHKGFYYHFLDVESGKRAWDSELSTIDTALLLAGALSAAAYFDGDGAGEREVGELAEALYRRADWNWACDGGVAVTHGWTPERKFLRFRWTGYNEALMLYALGLGSPTHPLPEASYRAWTESYRWKQVYGIDYLHAGPLFIHEMSHIWIDFRSIQDDYMRGRGIDYFENSRRAAYVQRAYAARNPRGFRGYNENCWGITASSGPGPATRRVGGRERRFYGYHARGVPYGPDDGTLAPWATVAALPFAPEIVLPAVEHFFERYPEMVTEHGITCSFNPTFPNRSAHHGWVSGGHYGLDQGPVVLMIENYRSGLLWRLMRRCRHVARGLARAGFDGGWMRNAFR